MISCPAGEKTPFERPLLEAPPLALYIHFPWCLRKCPYCDFNSHTLRRELPAERYLQALLEDLNRDLNWLKDRRPLTPLISIFLGGGTPSLFPPEVIARLLEEIRKWLPWHEEIEVTLEANPATLERSRLEELATCRINRLSLGVQSFQNHLLQKIGRLHTAQEAIETVEEAHRCGFRSLNIDLMYGLPGQTVAEGVCDVETALKLAPDHISYYQLTLEPGTPFAKKPPPLPDEETILTIEQTGRVLLEAAGYQRYEISAFAREGHRCRHNLNYWNFGDYLGIGAGAHSKITDTANQTLWRLAKRRSPHLYLKGEFLEKRKQVPFEERPFEFFMNVLRLRDGFSVSQFEKGTGCPWSSVKAKIEELKVEGFLNEENSKIRCTPWGWDRLDTILLALME